MGGKIAALIVAPMNSIIYKKPITRQKTRSNAQLGKEFPFCGRNRVMALKRSVLFLH